MAQVRTIDVAPAPLRRSTEMQVLCLGLSRTGTMSLQTAMERLGYKTYHFYAMLERPNVRERHLRCWYEALQWRRTGKGLPYGRPEFDKLLGNYSAVSDTPCANFAEELIAAYPNAKVVLNTRDVEPWLKSVERSQLAILEGWLWKVVRVLTFGKHGLPTLVLQEILQDWTHGDACNRDKLRLVPGEHNAKVRRLVAPENLLEHQPKDGWEPLCKFLGQPIPHEPYPRVNEGDNTWKQHAVGTSLMFVIFWLKIGLSIGALYMLTRYFSVSLR